MKIVIMLYFKYTTYIKATNFCKLVDQGENIPESINSVTQNYCLPIECESNFYVIADYITTKYNTATPVEMPIQPTPISE